VKPKHRGGYTTEHTELCERTLVTLLRGLGPWKRGLYLTGGLVPRYLIPERSPCGEQLPTHAGTTDVDLVVDLQFLASVEAYSTLEENLKELGFERGKNEAGRAQHFSWRKAIGSGITIIVDLLCEADDPFDGGQVSELPGNRRLSALKLPGAHLVTRDYLEIDITAELLDGRGQSTEVVRVANVVPFLVLKALAYDDRAEEKDAYDLVYCLMYYGRGPEDVAREFADRLYRWPGEPFLPQTLDILRRRFASDGATDGYRKDGPTSYARFLVDPGRTELVARHRRHAAEVVEAFLHAVDSLIRG